MTAKRMAAPRLAKNGKADAPSMNRPKPEFSARAAGAPTRTTKAFAEVVALIRTVKDQTYRAANAGLVDLHWRVGQYISVKVESAGWGDGVVEDLARYIQRHQPNVRGFTRASLFRMRQFYETYRTQKKVAAVLRQLPWTHHLLIMGRSRSAGERTFYLRAAARERWTSRDLEREIRSGLFERCLTRPPKLSPVAREVHPGAEAVFRDSYMLEFLGLPEDHSEADLHSGLIRHLGRFINELGRDFAFIGSEYPVQVGGRDFALDLLFFHRGLNCLVAIELKVEEFQPEHLGKLQFYLEALDRDVRKKHERLSIGVLLCASKDNEVVEYALARSTSPALIAEYQRMLPNKALLRSKLHEFHALIESRATRDKQGTKGT